MCFMEIFKNLAEKSLFFFYLKIGDWASWAFKIPSSLESVNLSIDKKFCFSSSQICFC